MPLILFTTTDLKSPRGDDFRRLLASVEAARDVPIRHYVLLQNASDEAVALWRDAVPGSCRLFAIPGRVSISEARNRLFEEALAEGAPGENDVVAFPDDDCWLPEGFPARLERTFAEAPDLDLLICRMSLDPEVGDFGPRDITPAEVREVVRISSSNNIFLRGSVVARLGPFDKGLGLGTPAGGGEDTDYVIRAYLAGRRTGMIDRVLIGHPTPDRNSAAKYFRGAMFVLARHARSRPGLAAECMRKVLVGLYFMGQGKLRPSEYARGLRNGAQAYLAARGAAMAGGGLGATRRVP